MPWKLNSMRTFTFYKSMPMLLTQILKIRYEQIEKENEHGNN